MDTFAVTVLTIAFIFALAGMVKGIIGMGLPTVAMGMLALVMSPVHAAALLVIPSLITNVWQLLVGPSLRALLGRFAKMMAAIFLGTFLGIGWLVDSTSVTASATLGAALAVYGAIGLRSTRFVIPRRSERWLSPVIGLFTGVLTGATGVFVIPAVPYFSSLALEKDDLIQVLGLSFTVSTAALAVALIASSQFKSAVAMSSLLALLPALGGLVIGQRIRDRLKPDVFRRWFFIALLILGVYMVVRAIGAV